MENKKSCLNDITVIKIPNCIDIDFYGLLDIPLGTKVRRNNKFYTVVRKYEFLAGSNLVTNYVLHPNGKEGE